MTRDINQEFECINEILQEVGTILIAAHEYPDADAVGAMLAVGNMLATRGQDCTLYLPHLPPKNLNFLPGSHKIVNDLGEKQLEFDLLFAFDYGDFARLRLPQEIEARHIITIDHHPFSSQRGDVCIIAPEYSSTSEIVYWWFKHLGFAIDQDIATCLLCGIIGDSGSFTHVSTSSMTFKSVGGLLQQKAEFKKVLQHTHTFYDEKLAKLAGGILSRIKINQRTGLAYSWSRARELELGTANYLFEDIPTIIATASNKNLGLFLAEERTGIVRGSLRSEPHSQFDVSALAKILGGGGHKYSAGFRYRGSLSEALKKVLELLE